MITLIRRVEDLRSLNGTYVNDRRIAEPTTLRPGTSSRSATHTSMSRKGFAISPDGLRRHGCAGLGAAPCDDLVGAHASG